MVCREVRVTTATERHVKKSIGGREVKALTPTSGPNGIKFNGRKALSYIPRIADDDVDAFRQAVDDADDGASVGTDRDEEKNQAVQPTQQRRSIKTSHTVLVNFDMLS